MKKQTLLIGAVVALGGCSWVDKTGSQSAEPDLQNDVNAVLLTENALYKRQVSTQQSVQANFRLIAEGPTAADSCNDDLLPVDSAATLESACDLNIDSADCAVVFRVDDTAISTYSAQIPKLRQSVALKYNVESQDINGNKEDNELTLCIQAVNDAPEANEHSYQVEYRSTLTTTDAEFDDLTCAVKSGSGVLKGATDDFDFASVSLSGQPCLTAYVVTPPSQASAFSFNELGGFSYSPKASQGPGSVDTFSYRVSDGSLDSEEKTVSIAVVGDNDAPTILPIDTFVLDQNTSVSIAIASLATDPEGEALNLSQVSTPLHGSTAQSADGLELSYTPQQDYIGEDSFNFTVQDLAGASAQGQIDVLVIRANQAPTINAPDSLNYFFNNSAPTSQSFNVTLDDLETDAAQLQLSATSSRGDVATVSTPGGISNDGRATISLTPINNGTTNIVLTVTDRGLSDPVQRPAKSTTTTVIVDIRGINRNSAPVAQNATFSVQQDSALSLDLTTLSSDLDGDSLSYTIVAPPTGVTLSGSTLNIARASTQTVRTFTLTYTVSDGDKSDSGTVTITVTEKPNSVPTAEDASRTVQAGDTATFDLGDLSSDADAEDTLSFVLLNPPPSASLNGDIVTVTTQESDADTTITVLYQVSDGEASVTGTLTIQVSELPNTAPTIGDASRTVQAGNEVSVDLASLANDTDNDPLTYSLVAPVPGATLTGSTLRVTTAATASDSVVRVTYRVSDGEASDDGVLTVTVTARPNTPPVMGNDSAAITAGESTSIDLSTLATDADGDPLSFTLDNPPSEATLSGSILTVTTTASRVERVIVVNTVVSDGEDTDTGTFSVTVAALPNTAPVTQNASETVIAGQSASVDLSGISSDADGDPLTYTLPNPAPGVTLSNSTITVSTLATATNQEIVVEFNVSDGFDSVSGTFTVTVTALASNTAPDASDGTLNVELGGSESIDLNTLATDSDLGDSLRFSLDNPPLQASLVGSTLTYTPADADAPGSVDVTYVATDDDGLTDSGTINVIISAAGA